MDTIKIEKKNTKLIAHRGLSSLERENTVAAFVAAGNRSYYGIETDVHKTGDGKYIIIHDDTTARVAKGSNMTVEESEFATLRSLALFDIDGKERGDLQLPTPDEYFSVCRKYEKKAVFELKNPFTEGEIAEIIEIVRKTGWLENTIFISFYYSNVKTVRRMLPTAEVQFLSYKEITSELVEKLKEDKLSLDVRYDRLNEKTMQMLRDAGITVNCWTVDNPEHAAKLVELGVDFITTNCLE